MTEAASILAGGIVVAAGLGAWLYVRREYKVRLKARRLRELGSGGLPFICVTCERELRQIAGGVFYHADRKAYPHRAMPV